MVEVTITIKLVALVIIVPMIALAAATRRTKR